MRTILNEQRGSGTGLIPAPRRSGTALSMVATRLGTALMLAAIVVAGLAMPAAAAQDPYGNGGQYDRDRGYHRKSMGRNRYKYSYNGRDYDYTIDNRRGDLEPREVAERAQRSGYDQGVQDGQYDVGSRTSRPNPRAHGAYQFALDGWDPQWGSGAVYQRAYREGYLRGYNETVSHNRGTAHRY